MARDLMLFAFALSTALALSARTAAQDQRPDNRIVYAPDIVGVGRLFMVALRVPPDAPELAVAYPDSITLLDRTPLPAKADERQYYFRAGDVRGTPEIRFAHPDGEIAIPLTIWDLDDLLQFRELKGTQLPRRWPVGETLPELKQSQTITTQADIDAARAAGPGGADKWLAMSDDDIWAMQPDSTIPRWHWVNVTYGCPVHGAEIYTARPYYPWIKDLSFPWKWKIECPIGHETYPSNDFADDDFTSGDFPDDGIGGACLHDGRKYGFIAEICQAYCHQMLQVAPDCARAYLATDDVRYLHKSLVAFCRLAVEYAYLATMTQHRHRNTRSQVDRLGQGRFDEGPILRGSALTVYGVDQPGYQWRHAEAYDMIFPDIERDPDIIPFLQAKGFDVKTHEDVRRFIEGNLFAVWTQATMDGAILSNEPYQQRGLARTAEVLNYARGDEFMDWLYDGEGKMRVFVPNTYFRDGSPYESTGGYNSMHVTALGPIVESIEHLREMRPEVYPEERYPSLSDSLRYRNVFDFCMDAVTIDRSFPQIGDTGGFPAYHKLPKTTWHSASAEAFEHAYRMFQEPKFAWALANAPGWQPSRDFPFTREQIEAAAAQWPDDWNDGSSLHDGYGVAILRGGKGDSKRALWLRYGRARGHTQDDLMDIGLSAHEGDILSHMGYPRNWGYWEYSWSSHHLARQFPYVDEVATAQLIADAGIAHVAEARAHAYTGFADDGTRAEPPEGWQRRMLALIDVSPEAYYCIDLYRVLGGDEHWWAFHCQEGEFSTEGIDLTPQGGGTLAGPDVPYGDEDWMREHDCTLHPTYGWRGVSFVFPHLYDVERGESTSPWSADWKLKTGDGLHMRLTVLQAGGAGADPAPASVSITDGTAPAGGNPYEMKWIMLHNAGESPARTQVLSLMETYLGEPVIREARPLALSGEDEAGFAAAACQVQLADRTDTLFASADPTVERSAEGGFRFAGRFGLYAERDGEPVAMSLVGGTLLQKGDLGIVADAAEYRGEIIGFDREAPSITVSPAPPNVGAMVGAYIFITNPLRRVGCKVVDATQKGDAVEIRLDTDPCIGVGQVTGAEDFRLLTDTPFPLQNYEYYEGARLANADGAAEYRINEVRSGVAAMIDAALRPEANAERLAGDFAEGSWFRVYDYGVGDEVVWPYAISVERTGEGAYRVTAPVEVRVSLPEGR